MTIVVFGASGNIGGATAAALLEHGAGDRLRLVTHRESGRGELAERYPGAQVCLADYFDAATLEAALSGASEVFMNVPDMTPEPEATERLVEALRRAAPEAFLLRFAAYPPGATLGDLTPVTQASGIGAAKHLRSKPVLVASGLRHAFLNAPCWFMTNLAWMSGRAIAERGELRIPCPQATAWIAPADIGAAAARVLLTPRLQARGREFTLTGPEMLDFEAVADILSEVLGRPIRYNPDVEAFREYFGEMTDAIVAYFDNARSDYEGLVPTGDLEALIGRPPTRLAHWLAARRDELAAA